MIKPSLKSLVHVYLAEKREKCHPNSKISRRNECQKLEMYEMLGRLKVI